MTKWLNHLMSVLICVSMISCSNLESSHKVSSTTLAKTETSNLVHISTNAPDIPFNKDEAFFPLRVKTDGKIVPSYQWRECTKRFVVCLSWQKKIIYFEDLSWFQANGYGLKKNNR